MDELKKIIIKIGVNLDEQPTFYKLLQSSKSEIRVLKKKLNLLAGEHPISAAIAKIEDEKEKLL